MCGDDDASEEDQIVFCDGCDLAVHQLCYGVKTIPEGSWKCDICALNRREYAPNTTACALCSELGGAYKATTTPNIWVHVNCAIVVPEVFCLDANTLSPFCLDNLDRRRFHLRCSNNKCQITKTVALQCSFGRCVQSVHWKCVDAAGWKQAERQDDFRVFCMRHQKIQGRKRKQRRAVVESESESDCESEKYNTEYDNDEGSVSCSDRGKRRKRNIGADIDVDSETDTENDFNVMDVLPHADTANVNNLDVLRPAVVEIKSAPRNLSALVGTIGSVRSSIFFSDSRRGANDLGNQYVTVETSGGEKVNLSMVHLSFLEPAELMPELSIGQVVEIVSGNGPWQSPFVGRRGRIISISRAFGLIQNNNRCIGVQFDDGEKRYFSRKTVSILPIEVGRFVQCKNGVGKVVSLEEDFIFSIKSVGCDVENDSSVQLQIHRSDIIWLPDIENFMDKTVYLDDSYGLVIAIDADNYTLQVKLMKEIKICVANRVRMVKLNPGALVDTLFGPAQITSLMGNGMYEVLCRDWHLSDESSPIMYLNRASFSVITLFSPARNKKLNKAKNLGMQKNKKRSSFDSETSNLSDTFVKSEPVHDVQKRRQHRTAAVQAIHTIHAISNNVSQYYQCNFGNRWCMLAKPCKDCKLFRVSASRPSEETLASRSQPRTKRAPQIPTGNLYVDNYTPIRISFREATAKHFSNDLPFINFWIKPTSALSKCITLYIEKVCF